MSADNAIMYEAPKISNQLVRSHLIVAAIGGFALILTFIALFLLRTDIETLAERLAPLDHASANLETGLDESLSALRGWVSLEDPQFITQWEQAWKSKIRPALADIHTLESSTVSLLNKETLLLLESLLDELQESQWWIKSVAHTPGNEPAAEIYQEQIVPVALLIQRHFDDLQSRIHNPDPLYSPDLMNLIVSLQREFSTIQIEVEQIVHHNKLPEAITYKSIIKKLTAKLQTAAEKYPDPIPQQLLLLRKELTAFAILSSEAEQIRQSQGWNRAQHLMQKETVPITNKTVSIVQTLSRRAAEQMTAKATQTKQRIALYIWATIILVLIAILTAMLVALQRSRSLSRPISELAQAANAYAKGELNNNIEIKGNREIESLGHSFNSMRKQINNWQKALKEANNSLEERVKTRTHELQTATQQLEENAEHLRLSASVFKHSVEGIAIADTNGHILDANDAFCKIHGYSKQEIIGKSSRFFQSGRHDHDFFLTIWQSISKTGQWRGEIWNRRKDGSIFPLWMTINDVRDSDGIVTNYLGTFSDISQIKQSQEELDFLAHHDPLTELPNRLLLLERLAHAISRAKREKEQLAVIFLDLDRFKQINDSLGHPHGDKLLQLVAKRLSSEIRGDDTLARLGGDEFVLLLEGITKTESVGITAQKLLSAFEAPFDLDNQEIRITASLGIAIYPQDGIAPTVLLRNADAAMYSAKDLGRNNYQFYTQKLTEDAIERVSLENGLRNAIDNRELYLLYQPQIDLTSSKIIGVEALLRWQSQSFGLVSPVKFIPLAEETGLIHKIGKWVLYTACHQGKLWLDQGIDIDSIAVNISGAQIRRGKLVEEVTEALNDSRLPPERLELEVTEGFILDDPDAAIKQLSTLRDIGVVISIDDFGTGYSSLSYIKRLPIQKLKIDQSFVRDIPNDADDMAIADAVIAMGHSLDLSVIAEGVETEEQAEFLTSHGCNKAQGFLFSKPIPPEEIVKLISKTNGLR